MLTRRKLLQYLPGLPLMGGLFGSTLAKGNGASAAFNAAPTRNLYAELGIRTFINARCSCTNLTGSLMPDEVMEAIVYGRNQFARLDEVHDRVGERLAQMLEAEAAMVTCGCFSAITLGTAGALTGTDPNKIERLPDTSGMKNEVIKLRAHDAPYAQAARNTGAKIIEVDTAAELEQAINENTAMMFFIYYQNPEGQVQDEEFVSIAKKHNIPALIDIAADIPPVDNLWKHIRMGYDMVAISGGKGLRGPQSSGILYGRKDLIAAARLHAPPNQSTIARGMKVNKEEMLGVMMALEKFINTDWDKQWQQWEEEIQFISDTAKKVPGVKTEYYVPEIANHIPTLRIMWDQDRIKTTPREVDLALRNGHPSIEVAPERTGISVTTWQMRPTEVPIVATRIREVLSQAAA